MPTALGRGHRRHGDRVASLDTGDHREDPSGSFFFIRGSPKGTYTVNILCAAWQEEFLDEGENYKTWFNENIYTSTDSARSPIETC